MKRIICLALVCLLLCGCGAQKTEPTEPAQSMEAVTPTEPAGSYLGGSSLEKITSGAVRTYTPDVGEIYAIHAVGNDLLVFSGDDTTRITRLTGENLFRVAEIQLDRWLLPETVYISEGWVVYFDTVTNELVFLGEDLQEFLRLAMPEDLEGYPVLSDDRKQVYYCTTGGVRCLDVESGISRLIKEMTFPIQSAADILLDGTVLAVYVTDGIGNTETLYLDAQTGSLLYSLTEDMQLKSGGEFYYAVNTEGIVDQMIFGTVGGRVSQLVPQNYLDSGVFLEAVHAAVVYSHRGLDYYDLETGRRTATLGMGELEISNLTAGGNGFVYFLHDGTIVRWDLSATPTADEAVYTGIRYSRVQMNEAQMATCQSIAQKLSQRYGIRILIGQSAEVGGNADFNAVTEYQTNVILDALTQLENLLSHFPNNFFETAVEGFQNGSITICLVRELAGSYASGSLENTSAIQFWDGEDAWVSLAMGETLEMEFYRQMFHVLESRILSETIAYYRWDELNPKGFTYDQDYTANRYRDGSKYLQAETRSFIDTFSMSFATEDRAAIMAYACMDGNEAYFQSATMQKKLTTLCRGIREAYGLENSTEVFLWEQYLNKPLAPQP